MKPQPWITLFAVLWAFGLAGRTWADETSAAASPAGLAYFERHVRPLLHEHCYECHSARDDAREGELTLDSREGILRGGSRGPLLVPGRPDASLLMQVLQYRHADVQMPPAGKLPSWLT